MTIETGLEEWLTSVPKNLTMQTPPPSFLNQPLKYMKSNCMCSLFLLTIWYLVIRMVKVKGKWLVEFKVTNAED